MQTQNKIPTQLIAWIVAKSRGSHQKRKRSNTYSITAPLYPFRAVSERRVSDLSDQSRATVNIDSYISHIRMRYLARPLNSSTTVIVYALILKETRVNPNADNDVIQHRDVKQGGCVAISISQNQERIVVKPSSERKKKTTLADYELLLKSII